MSAITKPVHNTIKKNIVAILAAVSAAEVAAGNPGFTVERDRYRSWEPTEDLTARVNVMMTGMTPDKGGSQQYTNYRASFNIDMYALGGASHEDEIDDETVLTPANIDAADRLDLLISQVQYGLTQLAQHDLGLPAGTISRNPSMSLTMSNQADDNNTTVFAPARFTIEVMTPYYAADNGPTFTMTEIDLKMKKVLEDIELKYTYGD